MLKKVKVLKRMTNAGNGKVYEVNDVKVLHPSYADVLIADGFVEYIEDGCGCVEKNQPEIQEKKTPKKRKTTNKTINSNDLDEVAN
jgi:hypothetical protein